MKSVSLPKVIDGATQRALSALEGATNFVLQNFLQVTLLPLSVTASPVAYSHKLNKKPTGFFVVNRSADIRVWSTTSDNLTITLQANTPGDITLIVF